jgi:hypothetical protein
MNNIKEQFIYKEDVIYKIILDRKLFFRDLPFNKENILNLFNTLSLDNHNLSSNIMDDEYFGQHLNNVLSKLVANNELLRIQKGLYSFSTKLIDFKISLEEEYSNLLIKDVIAENKLLHSEAVILEKNIFIPEYLINKYLHVQEREIFFKKFRQYKMIKTPFKEDGHVELYSLAKFYNRKKHNKTEYIKHSYVLLQSYLHKIANHPTNPFDDLLKYSKKNKQDFNFGHVSDFIKNLKKEMVKHGA